MEPWGYTLRQLVWMAEARNEQSLDRDKGEWRKIAWVCYCNAMCQTTSKAGRTLMPETFNPTVETPKPLTMGQMAEVVKKMPKTFEEFKRGRSRGNKSR